jgi:putative hydrolase of the HAD superfamily
MSLNGSQAAAAANSDRSREYKCIFFDLDHTLWDYECNAREMLAELHVAHNLLDRGIAFEDFHRSFSQVNFELWQLYDTGLINNDVIRTQRFKKVLAHFQVDDEKLNDALSHEYLYGCPKKSNLIPHAKEVLDYLAQHYSLTVVTNGFEEIQAIKLLSGNITHYFDHVITSQKAGHKKPAREIFDYALSVNGLRCDQVVMIGDNLITDIGGAKNASIDTIFYNPGALVHSQQVKHEIRCLSELQTIL